MSGSDGVDHLEYDLLVTNGFTAPVTLTSIAVTAPDGETLLQLDGDALVTATQPLLGRTPTADDSRFRHGGGGHGRHGPTRSGGGAPGATSITYEVAPDAPARSLIGSFAIDGPQLPVDPRPTTIIAPPCAAMGGWRTTAAARRRRSTARFASRSAARGSASRRPLPSTLRGCAMAQPFAGDGARPEDWYGFGAEVLAVADGTVVAVADGYPEQMPLQPVTHITKPEDFGGNAIVLEIAPGVYAYYAHLQPGSITVAVGDQVTTGQVLGLLGNTGNSSGPHLHFGLIDDPDPLVGEQPADGLRPLDPAGHLRPGGV